MFASVERFVLVTTAAWALYTLSAAIVLTTGAIPAFAEVLISIDKSTQRMSVSVDGVPQFEFAVSTGRAGYSTPNGTYHPQRLEPVWFSRVYYNSPMPNSIFFQQRLCHTRKLRDRSPRWARFAWLRSSSSIECQNSFCIGKTRGHGCDDRRRVRKQSSTRRQTCADCSKHWPPEFTLVRPQLRARLRTAATTRLPFGSGAEHFSFRSFPLMRRCGSDF